MNTDMDEYLRDAADGFLWAAKRAFELGLQSGTGGNMSLRLDAERFLVKPSGVGLRECRAADLVEVDGNGEILAGHHKPTKEVQAHLGVYRARPDVRAIVHYHAPFATAYAVKGRALPLPTLHAGRILKDVPLLPELPEGSLELARAVTQGFETPERKGLLLAHHGMIAVGAAIRDAQYHAELMEESARIDWLAQRIR